MSTADLMCQTDDKPLRTSQQRNSDRRRRMMCVAGSCLATGSLLAAASTAPLNPSALTVGVADVEAAAGGGDAADAPGRSVTRVMRDRIGHDSCALLNTFAAQ